METLIIKEYVQRIDEIIKKPSNSRELAETANYLCNQIMHRTTGWLNFVATCTGASTMLGYFSGILLKELDLLNQKVQDATKDIPMVPSMAKSLTTLEKWVILTEIWNQEPYTTADPEILDEFMESVHRQIGGWVDLPTVTPTGNLNEAYSTFVKRIARACSDIANELKSVPDYEKLTYLETVQKDFPRRWASWRFDDSPSRMVTDVNRLRSLVKLPSYNYNLSLEANYTLFLTAINEEISRLKDSTKCPTNDEKRHILKEILDSMSPDNCYDSILIESMTDIRARVKHWLILPRGNVHYSVQNQYRKFRAQLQESYNCTK